MGSKSKLSYQIMILLVACLLVLTACSPAAPVREPFFPVLKEPANNFPLILAQGWLVLENNYIRLNFTSIAVGFRPLIVWNYGYSFKIEGKEIRIIDAQGQTVAGIGDRIRGGFCTATREQAETLIREKLPDDCPEYCIFLVGVAKY